MKADPEDAPPVSSHRGERGFRRDVEGIRALAVLAVLLFHAQVPGISGGFVGVDIFFVVSGFLITGLLLREISTSGRVDFVRFYARRAKRLLPASTLVLVMTAAVSLLWIPASRWPSIATDIRGAALFVANWVFAARSTDYLGAEEAQSPVQHYWSLSVEEQFYFIWPALLAVFALLAVRRGIRPRRSLMIAMALVLMPSLAYSMWATANTPEIAYFSTFTRLWEMALGGVVALVALEGSRLPPLARTFLGWAGLVLILASLLLISNATPFPGVAALAPTLGAAALLVAGMGRSIGTVTKLLSLRWMVWIGGLSYSLYLWHWLVVTVVTEIRPGADWRLLLPASLAAIAPAWISLQVVENPIRHARLFRRRPAAPLMMAVGLIAGSLMAASLLEWASGIGTSDDASGIPAASFGAASLQDQEWVAANPYPQGSADPLVPSAAKATQDNAEPYSDGCQLGTGDEPFRECEYGDPDGTFSVVLAGDSHATSWVPALTRLARQEGWSMRTMLKSRCPLTDSLVSIDPDGPQHDPYDTCETWKGDALDRLDEAPPDLLLLTTINYVRIVDSEGNKLSGESRVAEIQRGFGNVAQQVTENGTRPVFIADAPLMLDEDGQARNVPDCVADNADDLALCATPRDVAIDRRNPVDRMLVSDSSYDWDVIDLSDGMCLPEWCPAVVGNVIVYRDYAHLTETYSTTLAPWLAEALAPWTPNVAATSPASASSAATSKVSAYGAALLLDRQ